MPDFYIPKFNFWVEIKGYCDEKAQRKIDYFGIDNNIMVLNNLWKINIFAEGLN
jgi:hypothetical protein